MDNPWATAWDQPWHPREQGTPTSWSTPDWSAAQGAVWPEADARWDPSANTALEQDITTHAQPASISQAPQTVAAEPRSATDAPILDHQRASPPRDSSDLVPETADAIRRDDASVTSVSGEDHTETVLNPPDDDWSVAWGTTPSSDALSSETQPSDRWEVARREKERLNRAVPPELLDSLLRHCQQVSQEIWPASEVNKEGNWRSGFDEHADIIALLAQLLPADSTLPHPLQFSATATAKAMNEALKLTRHSSAAASSPLSRLLASKGSLEWEKSLRTKQDPVPGTIHVGWRVLEKEDRLSAHDESKSKRTTGGLLSFWNRRASAIQTSPVEAPRERSSSPARSSQESAKSAPHPPSSRAASPPKASASVPPPLPVDPHPTVAQAHSAVSRFLNRFSRAKGAQHSALALSSDDLEFLSDVVPSASDQLDEDIDDIALGALTGTTNPSTLPPKLPPPIAPPPKQSMLSSRHPAVLGLGILDGAGAAGSAPSVLQVHTVNHTLDVPVLAPPLSPKPAASLSRTQSSPLSLNDMAISTVASGRSNTPSTQQRLQQSSQLNSQLHSPSTLQPPQRVPQLLSIPPLLPPPPFSPPQTPRPNTFPLMTPSDPSAMQGTEVSFPHDTHDSDDEFSAFTSFPPSTTTPFPSSAPYPSLQGSPSPPSPPPRRSYGRTHYPSSSSTSSVLSPASQSSLDQLYSTRTSVSASLDSFDDFVSPPAPVRNDNRKRTPSPPPLPVKSQLLRQQPTRLDTFSSRVYHASTPSQTTFSPTVHTSLMHAAFASSSVSDAEHRRTQGLVNQAAAQGGTLWPNSPDVEEPRVKAISPPPKSTSTSPKPLFGQEGSDLLGDTDTLADGLEVLPTPLSMVGMGSKVSPPASRATRQFSPPPLPSTFTPISSFASLGTPAASAVTSPGSLQLAGPKQTRGLSAQDLSFFEGL